MLVHLREVVGCYLGVQEVGVVKPAPLALQDLLGSEFVLSDPSMELQDLLLLSETQNFLPAYKHCCL